MNKPKFSKPPSQISQEEREKKADSFIDNASIKKSDIEVVSFKKEKTKALYLRAPEKLWNDLHEVSAITGISINGICLEALGLEIKSKLKALKEN